MQHIKILNKTAFVYNDKQEVRVSVLGCACVLQTPHTHSLTWLPLPRLPSSSNSWKISSARVFPLATTTRTRSICPSRSWSGSSGCSSTPSSATTPGAILRTKDYQTRRGRRGRVSLLRTRPTSSVAARSCSRCCCSFSFSSFFFSRPFDGIGTNTCRVHRHRPVLLGLPTRCIRTHNPFSLSSFLLLVYYHCRLLNCFLHQLSTYITS